MLDKKALAEETVHREGRDDKLGKAETYYPEHAERYEIDKTVFDLRLGKDPKRRDDVINGNAGNEAEDRRCSLGKTRKLPEEYHHGKVDHGCDSADENASEKLYERVGRFLNKQQIEPFFYHAFFTPFLLTGA